LIIFTALLLSLSFYWEKISKKTLEIKSENNENNNNGENHQKTTIYPEEPAGKNENIFSPPLDQPAQRITKKKFGDFITPQNSPVQPERFHGYHTGIDFEIFPDEKEKNIEVMAVCQGPIIYSNTVKGYGGVLIQKCWLENSFITVLYGHLNLERSISSDNKVLQAGERIGFLGQGYSDETDGERKHLHLSFHKGEELELRGYVPEENMLTEWLDPCKYQICD